MGRISVDIYPDQVGVGLEDVTSFGKYLGGSSTNVAVAAARHGRRAGTITRVGDDPFGRFLIRELAAFGVDGRMVAAVPGMKTPVTFCEILPPDEFPLYFYGREPSAPDLQVIGDDLDLDAVRGADVFWVTLTGLCREPSRTATLTALQSRGRQAHTVLDLDYRPMFWDSRDAAARQARQALAHATVAVGNVTECDVAVGERDPGRAAAALRALGVDVAVVKKGADGVLGVDPSGSYDVPPTPVEVVNGLGAGDGFGGALCHGLLAGWPLGRAISFASAAGAIVASRLACSVAMPTTDEVTAVLDGRARVG